MEFKNLSVSNILKVSLGYNACLVLLMTAHKVHTTLSYKHNNQKNLYEKNKNIFVESIYFVKEFYVK